MEFGFITRRLSVGTMIKLPEDGAALEAAGLTHVLNTQEIDTGPLVTPAGLAYFDNGTPDRLNNRPMPPEWFKRSLDWALPVLAADPANKIHVHCAGSIDRSTSTIYAILLAFGLDATDAEKLIRTKWPRAGLYYKTCAEAAVKQLGY
jgi:protein-tyrosine phosphatase